MGSNDKISESSEPHASDQNIRTLGEAMQAGEAIKNPEPGSHIATDKGLSTCEDFSEEMKQVDTGGLSFAELRNEDMYYVDKTLLIKDIFDSNKRGVHLFTRPRRFGKTTNLSMLDAFFNEKYKGNTWFDGMEISEYPEYENYKNAFPVIHLDMRASKSDTYEEFIGGMISVVAAAFEQHLYLLEWEGLRKPVRDLFSMLDDRIVPEARLRESIFLLSGALKKYSGKNVVILIDEYDCAVSDSFGKESHRPMLNFLRAFLGQALKSNPHLEIAYVTGIMQIAKQSIFSDLNNLKVNNVFSKRSDERFGFTESEVRAILDDSGCPDKFDLAKEWYDGYRFGDAEVYNPFSIMSFVSEDFQIDSYWNDSGKDVLIKDMLESISVDNYTDVLNLVTGSSIKSSLDIAFSYEVIKRSGGPLYSLMVMAGYLNAIPTDEKDAQGNKLFELSIPNEEVRGIVSKMMSTVYPLDTSDFSAFSKAILEEDAHEMERILFRVMNGASYINLNEAAYEAVIMTLTYSLSKKYRVKSEVPEGKGRVDIEFYPKVAGIPPMVFELKVAGKEEELDAKVAEAFEQIHDREYYNGMEGRVILVGMAFWNKVPKVRIDSVMNGDGFALHDEKQGSN